MKIENGKIEGNFTVNSEMTINGMVTGSITVVAGGKLYLRGTCSNNIIVQSGGSAFLYGTVGNDVHNAGNVEVEGTVNGSVLSIGAPFKKSDGAVIRGRIAT